jgi:hypothetical protein
VRWPVLPIAAASRRGGMSAGAHGDLRLSATGFGRITGRWSARRRATAHDAQRERHADGSLQVTMPARASRAICFTCSTWP